MDVINVISKYNLLVPIIYDLACLYFCHFWRMSLEEVDHPFSLGVSLG